MLTNETNQKESKVAGGLVTSTERSPSTFFGICLGLVGFSSSGSTWESLGLLAQPPIDSEEILANGEVSLSVQIEL